MAGAAKTRIGEHIEIEWLEGSAPGRCPNCGAQADMRRLLDIDYRPPDAAHRFVLQICPSCGVRFVDNTQTMDYGTEELIRLGWNHYQVQIGAGIWPISAPLTRIDKPAGARVLEIGGAYGFGLDFCVAARGWQGEGFDPSPLAAFGATELGLAIRQDYFGEDDLAAEKWGLAIATEVIEHLTHPPEFLRLMRAALKADGILVLTTPDAEAIRPDQKAENLLPLLSPGAHVVLQTAQSLGTALHDCGFSHVTIRREAASLVAYASARPFVLLENEAAARAMYRDYLFQRGSNAPRGSDLQIGFLGRAVFEAANDADLTMAQAAWERLREGVLLRYGLDLATLGALPAGAEETDLAGLARMMPLGLGMILYGRAMCELQGGRSRAELLPLFELTRAALDALQGALARHSLTDGLSASIRDTIAIELWLAEIAAGRTEHLDALLAAPDEALRWQGFIGAVNAGALAAARALRDGLPALPGPALARPLRRNALLALGNLALAQGGDAMQAERYAGALRELGEPDDHLILGLFVRLVHDTAYDAARRIARAHDIETIAARVAQLRMRQDALGALAVLAIQTGADEKLVRQRLDTALANAARPDRSDVAFGLFAHLVNIGARAAARDLWRVVEAPLTARRPPFDAPTQDALFTAGMLFLRERNETRRSLGLLGRLRDDLVKRTPAGSATHPLFWAGLRGEVVALQQLKRGGEAIAILRDLCALYPGAPADLLAQIGEVRK